MHEKCTIYFEVYREEESSQRRLEVAVFVPKWIFDCGLKWDDLPPLDIEGEVRRFTPESERTDMLGIDCPAIGCSDLKEYVEVVWAKMDEWSDKVEKLALSLFNGDVSTIPDSGGVEQVEWWSND